MNKILMQIRTSEFCGLSKNSKWKEWLYKHAMDLADDLAESQKNGSSCKNNTQKMITIYNDLLQRGKQSELHEFLLEEFPSVLMRQTAIASNRGTKKISASKYKDIGSPNKHGVFKSYNPSILTFPQKRIIIDPDVNNLEKRVRAFINDKVDADYIMIEDRAYVEYFLPKYKRESSLFPKTKRELVRWRKEHSEH